MARFYRYLAARLRGRAELIAIIQREYYGCRLIQLAAGFAGIGNLHALRCLVIFAVAAWLLIQVDNL